MLLLLKGEDNQLIAIDAFDANIKKIYIDKYLPATATAATFQIFVVLSDNKYYMLVYDHIVWSCSSDAKDALIKLVNEINRYMSYRMQQLISKKEEK